MTDFTAQPTRPRIRPASFYRRLNAGLLAGYAATALIAYFVLPLLVRGVDANWAWALLPLVLVTNGYWATLHEAIHGQLLARPDRNRQAGRLLAILWGSSFRLLRFGHLTHHRFNRHDLDHPDTFDPARTSLGAARLRFFAEILGGLYVIELLTPLLYLLPRGQVERLVGRIYAGTAAPMPRLRQLAEQTLTSPRGIREIRQDAILAWSFLLLGIVAWGPHWPAFVAFLFGRGLIVSAIDNVYHFRTPIDRVDFAYNLRLPRPLQALFLNMNMHRVHHRRMQAPWWQLPVFFAADREGYDDSLISTAIRQLRGPVPNIVSGGQSPEMAESV
ncbi:MAG: fatty acid desaturase [Rhodospirillaceae bacterium]|nr:fatty acid desaturase [Rhodospirillaceae bacterium]